MKIFSTGKKYNALGSLSPQDPKGKFTFPEHESEEKSTKSSDSISEKSSYDKTKDSHRTKSKTKTPTGGKKKTSYFPSFGRRKF
eukprot:CAMPEP_0167774318 /NCGR_PEP_ID=MMETSP0111_2-20121227/1932_1 /TAXON_ID=91324 /ORGANISM="Lotharella globosa, Strain CCCM811" /LENGTH=83 /DNA_ID=CAMNT_0007664099 /DNA_START=34 /DNA_END=285 /DNA_ORIENTATION=+